MTSTNEATSNKNLNNNSSDGGVKLVIKWKLGTLCRNRNSLKKASSCEKISHKAPSERNCCDVCVIGTSLLFGFMLLTLGVLTIIFPLCEYVQNEHLAMRTYNPNFIWWKDPQPEILLKVYVFNITNREEFIAGRDKKLKLQEVGPIVFREETENRDIVFHEENSTMSYTVSRRLVFKETANIEGILNQTIYVPNMALSAASFTSNNFFLKRSYNVLLKTYSTKPIVRATVYDYLFNMTDPVLELSNNLAPFIAKTKDTGVLQNIYKSFVDRVNVNIGTKHGPENFFKMNLWNHRPTVPRFYTEFGDCNATLNGATEGAMFPSNIQNDTVVWYWRKTLCRPVPLYFDEELTHSGLRAYKFILKSNVFDRCKNLTADCYKGNNLPNGLTDLSRCFFDQPIVASFPHFWNTSGPWDDYLEGMKPNMTRHQSYTIVEPKFGAPLNQRAASQSNIALNDLSSFKRDFARFSNMVIPMFWLEYYQEEITPIIVETLKFLVNILPNIQFIISGGLIIIGLCLLMMGYFRLRKKDENVSQK